MSYPNDPNQPNYGQQPPYGQQPGYGAPGPAPDNYLVWAILTTIFCCLPFGIVSIVKSSSVNGLWASGDFAGAQKASEDAKKWATWAAIAGVIFGVLYAIIVIATGALSFSGSTSTY